MDLTFVDADAATPAHLAAAYDEVLAPSFRSGELVTRGDLLRAIQAPDPSCVGLLAVEAGGEVAGVAVADWYEGCGVLLASYLAVRPGRRDRGVGRALVAHAMARWLPRLRPEVVLAEVEDPRHWPAGAYGDAEARLRLYWSLGGRVLDVPYFQPELAPGQGRVQGLLLMAFPTAAEAGPLTGVDARAVACFVDCYLERLEGPDVTDLDAEMLRAALREGPVVATVRGLPPARPRPRR